ncbi:hypothetical protein [Ekhidna sp.]|uniref:hypothetical protein n=1 Tax=Ekhidna sp. TaxID=2608089 RepID=UPI0032EA9EBB
MKRSFTLLILTAMISNLALAGGGWVKQKGTGYYKVSHWWVSAAKVYTFDGNTQTSPQEGIFNTSIYAEYGINDKLTAIMNLPFSKSANDQESISGIGDTDIAFKFRINKPGSQFALAYTFLLGLPLGDNSGGSDGSLQTGDGEFNQLMRFDLSRSFPIGKVNAYANIYAGYNNRTKGFSDEARFGLEAGAGFLDNKIWTIVRIDGVESFQNGDPSDATSDGATVFANNTEYIATTYEIAGYITDKIGVSAAYGSVLSASLIFASPSYSLGVFFDMK